MPPPTPGLVQQPIGLRLSLKPIFGVVLLHCCVTTPRANRLEKTLTISKEPQTTPTPPARITTPSADTPSREHPIKFPMPATQKISSPNHMNCRGEFLANMNLSILGRANMRPCAKIPDIAPKKMGRSENTANGIAASQKRRSNPETESSQTAEMQDATSTAPRMRMLIRRIIFCTTTSKSTQPYQRERASITGLMLKIRTCM
jgi:hypothetical protein